MYKNLIYFIRKLYNEKEHVIPLHTPVFTGNEKKYLNECIDSTYVSYVGEFVEKFEKITADYTGVKHAVAVVNGTAALHIALSTAGVKRNDEVITQPLTFVATANAICHARATPVFVDVEKETLGMSPEALEYYLKKYTYFKNDECYNLITKRRIKACVPVHVFGHPCRIDEIVKICKKYNITVIEDAAESLGSFYKGKHTGSFGKAAIISYNGNKTITTGGGGMIITDDKDFAKKAKHLTTTGKLPHAYEYIHDIIAFNYRLTNLNAAVGLAQMEKIEKYLSNKRDTALAYKEFFKEKEIDFVEEPENSKSNYWLNAILLKDRNERDDFLNFMNNNGIMVRPVWRLMNKLEMYKNCQHGDLSNAEWIEERLVNLPSSIKL